MVSFTPLKAELGLAGFIVFIEIRYTMKISAVKEKVSSNENLAIEMMRNPAELSEWVIWIRESSGKSYLLTNESDMVITTNDANRALLLLSTLGIKRVQLVL